MSAGVALVLTGSVVAAILLLRPGATAGPAAPDPSATSPSLAAGSPPAPTSAPQRAQPADPATALRQELTADSAAAEALVGQWIPQVSAKAAGMVVGGVTYSEPRIWAEFQSYRSRYPEALLVRSSDFSSFRVPGYWVTVIGRPFATADAANGWCSQEGFGLDDCFAKRLSHSTGPSGNSAPRK